MNWFLCTITATGKHNWELANEFKMWGIPTLNKSPKSLGVNENDKLVFWLAKAGYVGIATVTSPPFKPSEKKHAPWAGGTFRYGISIPINIDFKLETPLWVDFDSQIQTQTGIHVSALRRGFTLILSESGLSVSKLIKSASKLENEKPK